jgi:hypothetical protein
MSSTPDTSSDHRADPLSSATEEVRSAYDWVYEAARENPTLVVGGAVAIGALAALALMNRKPQSRVRTVEKRIGRELASMERALRRNRPMSTMTEHLADTSEALASRLGSWNVGALDGLVRRAADVSAQLARRGGWR